MFVFNKDVTATPCEPGVSRKVMAYNDDLMICEITFEKGAKGNMHSHVHTQGTYIVSGAFEFTVADETKIVRSGDTLLMPSNSVHGVTCLEAGVIVDIFNPKRGDFL